MRILIMHVNRGKEIYMVRVLDMLEENRRLHLE